MTENDIVATDLIHLVCIKDFSKEFKKEWGPTLLPFMKKGWATWADVDHYSQRLEEGALILEDNEYEINFPPENFSELYETNK